MKAQRAHIVLPQDLVQEIDLVVGPRGRSAFLVENARTELRRRKLLSFLHEDGPVWKDEAHPELQEGAAAWVRSLRRDSQTEISGPEHKEMTAQ